MKLSNIIAPVYILIEIFPVLSTTSDIKIRETLEFLNLSNVPDLEVLIGYEGSVPSNSIYYGLHVSTYT